MTEHASFAALLPHLSRAEGPDVRHVRAAFDAILAGAWTPVQVGAFAVTLRILGETAEVIEPIKKELRGDGPLDRHALTLELGDVLHYLARIARHYDIDLGDVMRENIAKIEARKGTRSWEKTA